ncbi:hypothetical protein Pryu01_01063 [Paraliobacillus ryukyuensis]|uniref:Putative 5xTM membrane YitT family protein n=1 Tax=Paraliobacillus ryukyuensis TaxID=200904 RepID=A0A366EFY8_9BACI|nr:YitT family protein [Paraliobacillus ryukyuensis]RBP00365.1 putative 5xTM membrane YitT family protein [Paraliobacillus ryukyuensis]
MKYVKIIVGIFIVSIGLITLQLAEIVTGGTAGLALNVSYLFDLPFSWIFFLINIPFYLFSIVRMGWKFTITTILSVSLLSLMTALKVFLPAIYVPFWIGAVLGGSLIGLGLSLLFANGSSLGGANILALFLHKRYKFNPGITNFSFDFVVVLTGIYTVGIAKGLASILTIVTTSVIISYFKQQLNTEKPEKQTSKKISMQKDAPTN